jgi:hypothetical protein
MKTIFNIIFFALSFIGAVAQDTEKPIEKYINFNIGFQNRVLLDEQKSALSYSSGEYLAGLSFTRNGVHSITEISLDAGRGNFSPRHIGNRWIYTTSYDIHGNATTDSFPVTSGISSGKLQISYLNKLSKGRTIWLAGAALKELLVYPDNNIGLLNSIGIHIKLGLLQQLGSKGRFQADLSFPLFAVNTRLPWHNTATSPLDPEFATFFKKGTRLVGIDKFRMLEFNMNYHLHIAKHWSLGAGYSLTWLNVPYYQPMRSYMNSFKVQTTYIF